MITKNEFRKMCIEDKLTAIFEKIKSLSRPAPAPVQEAEEVLTVKQCAALLGYSTDHIYAQVSKSLIPYYKVGGSLRFRKSEVLEWAFKNRQAQQVQELKNVTLFAFAVIFSTFASIR